MIKDEKTNAIELVNRKGLPVGLPLALLNSNLNSKLFKIHEGVRMKAMIAKRVSMLMVYVLFTR